MRIRIRERDGQRYIVDEKPTKSFTSFLRKSFEEKVEEISDFHTISVTFPNDQDKSKIKVFVDNLINEFLTFLKDQFPESEISTKDRRNYGTENYLNSHLTKASGKRKGSQGNRFVRTKLVIMLNNEKLELIIYPLFSISDSKWFWGWLETRMDDRNYVVRRMLAQQKGFPSMYDLLFPPQLYPHHYEHKLNSSYHK